LIDQKKKKKVQNFKNFQKVSTAKARIQAGGLWRDPSGMNAMNASHPSAKLVSIPARPGERDARCLALHPTQPFLAVATGDQSEASVRVVKAFSAASSKEKPSSSSANTSWGWSHGDRFLHSSGGATCVSWDSASRLVTGGDDGCVRVFSFDPEKAVEDPGRAAKRSAIVYIHPKVGKTKNWGRVGVWNPAKRVTSVAPNKKAPRMAATENHRFHIWDTEKPETPIVSAKSNVHGKVRVK
jgi:hypothetical protein